jgi:hypothetical protein
MWEHIGNLGNMLKKSSGEVFWQEHQNRKTKEPGTSPPSHLHGPSWGACWIVLLLSATQKLWSDNNLSLLLLLLAWAKQPGYLNFWFVQGKGKKTMCILNGFLFLVSVVGVGRLLECKDSRKQVCALFGLSGCDGWIKLWFQAHSLALSLSLSLSQSYKREREWGC